MGHYFLSFTAGIIYDRGERVNNVDDVTRKRRDGQDSWCLRLSCCNIPCTCNHHPLQRHYNYGIMYSYQAAHLRASICCASSLCPLGEEWAEAFLGYASSTSMQTRSIWLNPSGSSIHPSQVPVLPMVMAEPSNKCSY